MSKKRIVVFDTSVLILIAVQPPQRAKTAEDAEKRLKLITRRTHAEATLRTLHTRGFQFHVPAPVVTELLTPPALEVMAKVFNQSKRPIVRSFDERAASIANRMYAEAVKRKKADEPRACVKYDLLIAAIAHHVDATYLVTANPRDFDRHLRDVGSHVQVLRADEPNLEINQVQLPLEQREPDDDADDDAADN